MTLTALKLSLGVVLVSALLSCSSSPAEKNLSEAMDIELKKSPAQGQAAENTSKIMIPADAKIDWQAFFKAPPDAQQRSLLEQELKSIQETSDVNTLLKKGRNELALGQYLAAEASFRRVLRQDSDNTEALLELAQFNLRIKNLERTFEFLAQLKDNIGRSDEKNATLIFRYRYTLALGLLARGETDEGHKILSDLIGLDKGFSPGYAALAASYLSLGKTSVADFIVRRGLDRGGENDAALNNLLGVIADANGEKREALNHFNKSLQLNPAYIPAIVNRANAMIESRHYDTAELDLKKALVFSPSNISARVALGVCYKKMGRLDASRAEFTRAIELDPESAAARFNLAVLLVDQFKKPDEAIRLFEEVVQTKEYNPDLKQRAQLYLGDLKENR